MLLEVFGFEESFEHKTSFVSKSLIPSGVKLHVFMCWFSVCFIGDYNLHQNSVFLWEKVYYA